MIELPKKVELEMMRFFLSTSVLRILEENKNVTSKG